jgi:hypothetical protein
MTDFKYRNRYVRMHYRLSNTQLEQLDSNAQVISTLNLATVTSVSYRHDNNRGNRTTLLTLWQGEIAHKLSVSRRRQNEDSRCFTKLGHTILDVLFGLNTTLTVRAGGPRKLVFWASLFQIFVGVMILITMQNQNNGFPENGILVFVVAALFCVGGYLAWTNRPSAPVQMMGLSELRHDFRV